MTIAPDDFKILADTLEKSSNRTRSIYYVFAIIYVWLTLYAVNAFVFPIRHERMKEIRTYVTDCQQLPRDEDLCKDLAGGLDQKKGDAAVIDLEKSPGFQRTFERSGLQHRRDTYLDEIAASRKFTFPLFGVSVDQDYFWLMNSLVGVIIYFVLIPALANEADLFGFMVAETGDDRMRLRIVLSSQVLSSPSDHHANTSRSYILLKKIVAIGPSAAGRDGCVVDIRQLARPRGRARAFF